MISFPYFCLLISLTLAVGSSSTSTFNPDIICTLIANGTKINDPRACNAWIQCINERPVSGTCEDGHYYDRETEDCLPAANVTCISSDPCAVLANGFAADPYSCNGYYYCKNGIGTRGECNAGLNFNPGTEACIRDYECPAKMNPDSYCNILPDGVFIKTSSSCNGYQLCWQGEIFNGTCPGTFYFSAFIGKCDYPQNVVCAFTPAPPPTALPHVCPEAGTFVSDNSTCNGYYYCRSNADGQMVLEHGVCDDGRFFHGGNGGACVPRTDVLCDYNRCVGLGETSIQLANMADDGCTGFAVCQNGTTISEGFCPNGQYFDELTQLCTTQVISYKACALTTTEPTTVSMIDETSETTTMST